MLGGEIICMFFSQKIAKNLKNFASILQLPESFVQLRPRSGSVFRPVLMIYFVMRTKANFSDDFRLPNFQSAHSATPMQYHFSPCRVCNVMIFLSDIYRDPHGDLNLFEPSFITNH